MKHCDSNQFPVGVQRLINLLRQHCPHTSELRSHLAMVSFPIRDDTAEKRRDFSFHHQRARHSRVSVPQFPSAPVLSVAVSVAGTPIQSPGYINSSRMPAILACHCRPDCRRTLTDSVFAHPRAVGGGIPTRNNRPCDCEPPL